MANVSRSSTRVAEGGRIVIPSEMRKRCRLDVGTKVVISVEDGHVIVMNAQAAIKRAQAIVARHVSRGISLSEELMAERKEEAKRE